MISPVPLWRCALCATQVLQLPVSSAFPIRSLTSSGRRLHTSGPQTQAQSPHQDRLGIPSAQDTAASQTDISDEELMQNQYRFTQGEVYSPHDLTLEEMQERRQQRFKRIRDAFDILGVDPRKEYKNFNLLGGYVSDMGRITHSKKTGLRPVNQRRIAKAIRRAVGIGFLPSTHRHPELLKAIEARQQSSRRRPGW